MHRVLVSIWWYFVEYCVVIKAVSFLEYWILFLCTCKIKRIFQATEVLELFKLECIRIENVLTYLICIFVLVSKSHESISVISFGNCILMDWKSRIGRFPLPNWFSSGLNETWILDLLPVSQRGKQFWSPLTFKNVTLKKISKKRTFKLFPIIEIWSDIF